MDKSGLDINRNCNLFLKARDHDVVSSNLIFPHMQVYQNWHMDWTKNPGFEGSSPSSCIKICECVAIGETKRT